MTPIRVTASALIAAMAIAACASATPTGPIAPGPSGIQATSSATSSATLSATSSPAAPPSAASSSAASSASASSASAPSALSSKAPGHIAIPVDGITKAAAEAAALARYPEATGVVRSSVGRAGDFFPAGQAVPPETVVWAVVLTGSWAETCGPSPAPSHSPDICQAATTATVLLDYQTGAVLETVLGRLPIGG